jgi:hypothetical protein
VVRGGRGGRGLSRTPRRRLWWNPDRAPSTSDDRAMTALWSTFDGPALVRAAAARFGLTGTVPPADPGQWGRATITATDVARFLAALARDPAAPAE